MASLLLIWTCAKHLQIKNKLLCINGIQKICLWQPIEKCKISFTVKKTFLLGKTRSKIDNPVLYISKNINFLFLKKKLLYPTYVVHYELKAYFYMSNGPKGRLATNHCHQK